MSSAHPEALEGKEADPTWVEQEGISYCLKLPAGLTTNLKAETSAGESREEGTKARAGWQGLLFWGMMNAMHQAGNATSMTREAASFVHCISQLLPLGQGHGHAHPAPGNMGARQSLLPSRLQSQTWPHAWEEQQVLHEARSWGIFRKKKRMPGVSRAQIFRKHSLPPFPPFGRKLIKPCNEHSIG